MQTRDSILRGHSFSLKNGKKLCRRPDMRQHAAIVIDNNRVYLGVSHYIAEISNV